MNRSRPRPASAQPRPRGTFLRAEPPAAAWTHRGARDGFEVVFFRVRNDSCTTATGATSAVQDGDAWAVEYALDIDAECRTRRAAITARSTLGTSSVLLESDGDGRWRINGERAPMLDHCLDVDLESSAFTNALPARRLHLSVGAESAAPAAFVRAADLRVERLEQTYARAPDRAGLTVFAYEAPAFAFKANLSYDADGLVRDYPGLAQRVS